MGRQWIPLLLRYFSAQRFLFFSFFRGGSRLDSFLGSFSLFDVFFTQLKIEFETNFESCSRRRI